MRVEPTMRVEPNRRVEPNMRVAMAGGTPSIMDAGATLIVGAGSSSPWTKSQR